MADLLLKYLGPHGKQSVENVGALLRYFGPGADVQGAVDSSKDTMDAVKRGDIPAVLSGAGMTAAELGDMVLPGNITGMAPGLMGMVKKTDDPAKLAEIQKLAKAAENLKAKRVKDVSLGKPSDEQMETLYEDVERKTGEYPDLEDIERVLNFNGARHGFKEHGVGGYDNKGNYIAGELSENAIPVTAEDLEYVEGILKTGTAKHNKDVHGPGLLHTGEIPTGVLTYVETVDPVAKPPLLKTKTFYKNPKKKPRK